MKEKFMVRRVAIASALFGIACSPSSVFAAQSDQVVISPLLTLGKLALALFLVLLLFWISAWMMRHLQGAKGVMHKNLQVVGALSLGQRERVIVVQVGDEQLVLGVTASQINTLHILSKPLECGASDAADFRQKLGAALQRRVVEL